MFFFAALHACAKPQAYHPATPEYPMPYPPFPLPPHLIIHLPGSARSISLPMKLDMSPLR